jgi:hypothetical protein
VGRRGQSAGLRTVPELGLDSGSGTEQREAEIRGGDGYGGEGRPWRPLAAMKKRRSASSLEIWSRWAEGARLRAEAS